MARFRPVSKFKSYTHQALASFRGTRNGFSRGNNNLRTASSAIILAITGNLNFPTPPISLVDLGTLHDAYTNALLAWGIVGNRGSKVQHQTMLDAKANLIIAMTATSKYVTQVSQSTNFDLPQTSQLNILLSSKAAANRQKANNTPLYSPARAALINRIPARPVNFRSPYSKHTVSGYIRLRWGKVPNVKAYNIYDINLSNFHPVITVTATIANLPSLAGTKYQFQVQPIGQNGLVGPKSQVLTAYGKA